MSLLSPLAWIYATIMDIRNRMFDRGWLKERAFEVPIVSIGNLAVGGTGKTPHTEWIVERLIESGKSVAILSRGYGRRTKGYIVATPHATANDIGDEPLQMYQRFEGQVVVAVCEDRCRGIENLMQTHSELQVIVLDDAYQHRYVKPAYSVLLTDYSRTYDNDEVMPAGRLRERKGGARRADAIIVTKCPPALTRHEAEAIKARLAPLPHQQVFFTTVRYQPLSPARLPAGSSIALLAGIANPEPLRQHLVSEGYRVVSTLLFRDHHNFTATDLRKIDELAAGVDAIVTTAKDSARLQHAPLEQTTLHKILVQDISVEVLHGSWGQGLPAHIVSRV